ncbi:MAG: YifB family Mg chelatase-like AAA ATPase [Pseudohongiellaceae bacterium]
MSFATVHSRALLGVEAVEVTVEAHLTRGLPAFAIVGLPETAVKESKERVRSAILNAGLEFPERRITVNLGPADIPKTGGRYDLAIALGILAAFGQISAAALENTEILGELALNGRVRAVHGALPALLAARRQGRQILLPDANAEEMRLIGYSGAYGVKSLLHYLEHALRQAPLTQYSQAANDESAQSTLTTLEVKGQLPAKRAIQVAAAGGHNLLMMGPPGCGKTLLAQVMVNLLPPLAETEALEVAAIRSVAGMTVRADHWRQRPLRAPHHCATAVALVGGGNRASPGEISLAHRGVLFLDELTEFKQGVLDSLREPMESGEITICRANYRVAFPADFQLLAAMNPCPCGHATDPRQECRCSSERINRYLGKLSGPLLDRIDLMLELPSLSQAELLEQGRDETDWAAARTRIQACRERQLSRAGKLNSELEAGELETYCGLDSALQKRLADAMDRLGLSARSVHRIIKVARTVADYEDSAAIRKQDLMEALSYRNSRLVRTLAR